MYRNRRLLQAVLEGKSVRSLLFSEAKDAFPGDVFRVEPSFRSPDGESFPYVVFAGLLNGKIRLRASLSDHFSLTRAGWTKMLGSGHLGRKASKMLEGEINAVRSSKEMRSVLDARAILLVNDD